MFGMKKKTKTIKNGCKDLPSKPKDEKLSKPKEEEKVVVPEQQNKFNFSKALGKSEEKLQSDFYVFQIKEFMKKVGLFLSPPTEILSQTKQSICSAKKFYPTDVLLSPLAYLKLGEECELFKEILPSVILDFPFGEGDTKSRKKGVSTLKKYPLGEIIISLPQSLDNSFIGQKEVNEITTLAKKSVNFGVMVNCLAGVDAIKKTILAYKKIAMKSFTLFATDLFDGALIDSVQTALSEKGDKKLYVITSLDTAEGIATLTSMGVDRVYTPFVQKVGLELTEKFSVCLT